MSVSRFTRSVLAASTIAAAAFVSATAAQAGFIGIKVVSNGSVYTDSNNTGTIFVPPGTILNSVVLDYTKGQITNNANNFRFSLDVQATNPTLQSKTVTYRLTATDLTGSPANWVDHFFGTNAVTYTNDSSAALKVFFNDNNAAFGQQTLVYQSNCGVGVGAYDCSNNGALPSYASPFSLTSILTLSFRGNKPSTMASSSNVFAVPEPASMALLGFGLLATGWAFRRRPGAATRGRGPAALPA